MTAGWLATIYVFQLHDEVLGAFTSLDAAMAFATKRGVDSRRWDYRNSHGECWTNENYSIQKAELFS